MEVWGDGRMRQADALSRSRLRRLESRLNISGLRSALFDGEIVSARRVGLIASSQPPTSGPNITSGGGNKLPQIEAFE